MSLMQDILVDAHGDPLPFAGLSFNPEKNLIYVLDEEWENLHVYNLEGESQESVQLLPAEIGDD